MWTKLSTSQDNLKPNYRKLKVYSFTTNKDGFTSAITRISVSDAAARIFHHILGDNAPFNKTLIQEQSEAWGGAPGRQWRRSSRGAPRTCPTIDCLTSSQELGTISILYWNVASSCLQSRSVLMLCFMLCKILIS